MRGDRLKTLREKSGFTHTELAALIDVGYAQIYRWEAGKADPSGDVLIRMADIFNVSVDYLLGRTKDPTPRLETDDLSQKERAAIVAWRRGQKYEAIRVIVADE